MARSFCDVSTRYLLSTIGITSLSKYASNFSVLVRCTSRGEPCGTAWPNGITTIISCGVIPGEQVVHDEIRRADHHPTNRRVVRTVQQIEHRVLLLVLLVIVRWRVDREPTRVAERLGPMEIDLDVSVRRHHAGCQRASPGMWKNEPEREARSLTDAFSGSGTCTPSISKP